MLKSVQSRQPLSSGFSPPKAHSLKPTASFTFKPIQGEKLSKFGLCAEKPRNPFARKTKLLFTKIGLDRSLAGCIV